MLEHPLRALDTLTLELRRWDDDGERAHLRLRFDKLVRHGLFVRTSVELSLPRGPLLQLEADRPQPTAALKSLLYPLAEGDAEWSMMRWRETAGLNVVRVEKGTVGPFFLHGLSAHETSHPFAQLVSQPGRVVATFGNDMAGSDVQEDHDNDPLGQLIGKQLSGEASSAYRQARRRWGYHVFKNRKFVCSAELVEVLRSRLTQLGTRNPIYPLRSRR